MLLGSKPGACIRLNRNGTRCQHNISELLRFCGFQGLWKFPYSKRGELVAVAFRVRRSDNVTPEGSGPRQVDIRVCGPLTGPSGFGVRSPATKSFDELGEMEKIASLPRAQSFAQKMLELCYNGLLQLTLTKTKP